MGAVFEKNGKYYLGMGLFIYSFIPYVVTLFILPFLSLTDAQMLSIAAILMASAEVAFLLCAVLLGKPFVQMLTAKIKAIFFRRKGALPARVSRTRHRIGIAVLLISVAPYYITEIVLIFGQPSQMQHYALVALLIAGDLLFMTSLIVLGGEFWERLKNLFEWPGGEGALHNTDGI